MAFWGKLIPDRLKKNDDTYLQKCPDDIQFKIGNILNPEETRLFIFRDCIIKGRRLLYDSKSVSKVKVPVMKSKLNTDSEYKEPFREVVDGFGYKFTCLQNDVQIYGEMMFGCVAMSYHGRIFKVHKVPDPPALMISMIVPVYHKSSMLRSSNSAESSVGSVQDYLVSGPTSACLYELNTINSSTEFLSKSGVQSCLSSYHGSFQSASSSSLSSRGSYIKRCQLSSCYAIDKSDASDTTSQLAEKPRIKLGCAILFDMNNSNIYDYLYSHMTTIQQHMSRLTAAIVSAYLHSNLFLYKVSSALEKFRQYLNDLSAAPRISDPIWLSLTSVDFKCNSDELAGKFLSTLINIQDKCDTKSANFFLSRILTGVLSHHLSWISTVLPSMGDGIGWKSWKYNSDWSEKLVNVPYNPLRMQLADLYGGFHPTRSVKVIVVGTGSKANLAKQLLFILSYFVRMSPVRERKNITVEILSEEDCNKCIEASNGLVPEMKNSKFPHKIRDPSSCPHRVSQSSTCSFEIRSQRKVTFTVGGDEREILEDYKILVDLPEKEYRPDGSATGLVKSRSSPSIEFKCSNGEIHPVLSHSSSAPGNVSKIPIKIAISDGNSPRLIEYCSSETEIDGPFNAPYYLRHYHNLRFTGQPNKMLQMYLNQSCCKKNLIDDGTLSEARVTFCEHAFLGKKNSMDQEFSTNGESEMDIQDFNEVEIIQDEEGISFCSLPTLPSFSGDVPCDSLACTLYGAFSEHFIPDIALMGLDCKSDLSSQLYDDLLFTSQHSVLSESKSGVEAVSILIDVDHWNVELLSSQMSRLDKTPSGVNLGMSPLVSSLLETTCHLWRIGVPAQTCLAHLESRLQELYCHSKVMAEYLLTQQVSDMNTLIKDLGISVNDVPLLLAIASTHTPHLASIYGVGFG